MNLRSSHLANMGARLVGVAPPFRPARAAGPAREPASQAPCPIGDSRASPDDALRCASGDQFLLTLTPNVQATLLLAAKAAGLAPGEFVARAIVAYAQEAVGFPALADELFEAPEPARIGESRFRCAADHAGVPP